MLCGALLTNRVLKPRRMLPKRMPQFSSWRSSLVRQPLSYMAVCMGYTISAPVDIEIQPQHDLLNRANRERLGKIIEEEDPYLTSIRTCVRTMVTVARAQHEQR